MKKVLALVLCVIIALTLSVSAFAESSPESGVIIIKGIGTKQSGASIPKDTYVQISEDEIITAVADEETYGKFIDWSIYVIDTATGTAAEFNAGAGAASVLNLATATYSTAKEGTDYTILSGYSLKTKTIKIKRIGEHKLAICGNYYNEKGQKTVTDPLKTSDAPGNPTTSSHTSNDLGIMYVAIVMLAAAAVVFGVKRQLSK